MSAKRLTVDHYPGPRKAGKKVAFFSGENFLSVGAVLRRDSIVGGGGNTRELLCKLSDPDDVHGSISVPYESLIRGNR